MKQYIFSFVMAGSFIIGLSKSGICQTDAKLFSTLLRQYEQSIDRADTVLGAAIWSNNAEVSFINPRSTEYGWNGIKNIYKMFADNFTERELHGFNEKVNVYGDVAWLTFEWVFDAVFRNNNQKIQTKGRETQIWHKEKGNWKLVHVHYSGLPVSGQGRGF